MDTEHLFEDDIYNELITSSFLIKLVEFINCDKNENEKFGIFFRCFKIIFKFVSVACILFS